MATLDNERNDALFVLAAFVGYRRYACQSVEARARMVCLLTVRHGRVLLLQAWKCSGAKMQLESMPLQALDRCGWLPHSWLCNGLQRFAACVT